MDDSYFNRKRYLKLKLKEIDLRIAKINNIITRCYALDPTAHWHRDIRERGLMDAERMIHMMTELKQSLFQMKQFYLNCMYPLID